MKNRLSKQHLHQILSYDPDSGIFRWKVRNTNSIKIGDVAGGLDGYGYLVIGIDGMIYRAHRLAWMYTYGKFPEKFIDHINHDKLDNRIENLRDVTALENCQNRPMQKNNKTGHQGIYWDKSRNKWAVQIRANNKTMTIGRFIMLEDAIACRKEAEDKYGFHPNHGLTS